MNKNRFSFVLALLLHSFILCAQDYIPFPTDSTSWKIKTTIYGDCNPWIGDNCYYYDKLVINGDTTINDVKYSKLFLIEGNSIHKSTFLGGLREDETKKIFYRGNIHFDNYVCDSLINDSTEILLYDFGLSIGDSIRNLNFSCARESVYDIDSIEYAGKLRKRYRIQRNTSIDDNYWLEGVGSTKGLFYPLLNWFEWDWELTCFEDNISDWTTSECITVGLHDLTSINSFISLFPNPLKEESKLHWDRNQISPKLIEIYSLIGKKVYTVIPTGDEIIIKRSFFTNSGLYLINLQTEKEIVTRRLIVQ